jgi:hypothetical protein
MPVDVTTQIHAFVLKVTNSTLGLVRLQISLSSQYKGEPSWNDHRIKNPALEDLLVETLTDKHVDAFVLTTSNHGGTESILKSDVVVLHSAEDSIADIGKVLETPEQVVNWDSEKALLAAASTGSLSSLEENHVAFFGIKVLAEKSGSVWFELICATKLSSYMQSDSSELFSAFPLSLQIEVCNGSWESSLIKANPTEGEEADKVVFDLVVTWPSTQTMRGS